MCSSQVDHRQTKNPKNPQIGGAIRLSIARSSEFTVMIAGCAQTVECTKLTML